MRRAISSSSTAEGSANYEIKVKKFLKADKAARKLIVTTVEKKPLDLLLSCINAREMWKILYNMKSDENLSMVQKQFFHFKWRTNESVAHNLSNLEQLSTKMKFWKCGSRINVTDEHLVYVTQGI